MEEERVEEAGREEAEATMAVAQVRRYPIRPLYWHYICEAAREIGILLMVFSLLDFKFEYSQATGADLWLWMGSGAAILAGGIFAAKEIK